MHARRRSTRLSILVLASAPGLGLAMIPHQATAACINGDPLDCNPPGTTLNAAARFIDPSPPPGYAQCAGFINTAADDVSPTWENNCIPYNGGDMWMRVFDTASGNLIAGAHLFDPVACPWGPTHLGYDTDQPEGAGLLGHGGLCDESAATTLAWYPDDQGFCVCGAPGGSRTCDDVFTASDANDAIFYAGGNSTDPAYEAVFGPPGGKNTCSLDAGENHAITVALYAAVPVSINEIRIDQEGIDDDEYVELVGAPGTPLDGLTYLVIGDAPTGVIEAVVDLTGEVIPASGYFVMAEGTYTLGVADLTTNLNLENDDTVTHMLVGGFTGAPLGDVDANDDGVLDSTPWGVVYDALALIDPGSTDLPYGPGAACVAGPACAELTTDLAGHVFRCPDVDGGWNEGQYDVAALPASDSPGAANPCACGDGLVVGGEGCDDGGESAACDTDCTAASCGDFTVNGTAGETCDTGGETALCDADCTTVECGDGLVNMTIGEICDDAGESATCDADCTAAGCGDGVTNVAAGEDCDDGAESVDCNGDCTVASCGDGVTNETAGEDCDDGGESATCDVDCTPAACGDMVVNNTAGETCDDGERTGACNDNCTVASCGDGLVNATAGEECDGDGAGNPGETADCDDDCTTAMCGDGVVNATANEECDDGNADDGDGCSATCVAEEPGTTSDGSSSEGGSSDGGDTTDSGDTTSGEGSGSTAADTSGASDSATATDPSDGDESSDDDGDGGSSGGSGGSSAGDGGCGCTADDRGDRRGIVWSVLALLGLANVRRRRD